MPHSARCECAEPVRQTTRRILEEETWRHDLRSVFQEAGDLSVISSPPGKPATERHPGATGANPFTIEMRME